MALFSLCMCVCPSVSLGLSSVWRMCTRNKGILSCPVPRTVYAFGAQVFQYPWGYFSDLHQVVTQLQ